MKNWYESKTIWVNIVALGGSIALYYGIEQAQWAEISVLVLAVLNIGLRLVTGTSITEGDIKKDISE